MEKRKNKKLKRMQQQNFHQSSLSYTRPPPTSPATKRILVLNSHTQEAYSVAECLIHRQRLLVRCLTNDKSTSQAQKLSNLGAELVEFNLDQINNLEHQQILQKSLADCHGVFVIQDSFSFQNVMKPEVEYEQGKKLADILSNCNNIKHIILYSLPLPFEGPLDEDEALNLDSISEDDKSESKSSTSSSTKFTSKTTTNPDSKKDESKKKESEKSSHNPESTKQEESPTVTDQNVKHLITQYFTHTKKLPVTTVFPSFPLSLLLSPHLLSIESEANSITSAQPEASSSSGASTEHISGENNKRTEGNVKEGVEEKGVKSVDDKHFKDMSCGCRYEENPSGKIYKWKFPMNKDLEMQCFDKEDEGEIIAAMFERPLQFLRRSITLKSDYISMEILTSTFTSFTFIPSTFHEMKLKSFKGEEKEGEKKEGEKEEFGREVEWRIRASIEKGGNASGEEEEELKEMVVGMKDVVGWIKHQFKEVIEENKGRLKNGKGGRTPAGDEMDVDEEDKEKNEDDSE
eukprot:TRINITY_DN10805_c0_g1_i1.p1 TRINITY_DN10805_c0_g1~~TRINITY_DN10805_c0_g1_i1.p1  ORF type:complete len:517 (+),score=148.18 TRINITY_DN10805_c0_g1_i1:131-1681(+)